MLYSMHRGYTHVVLRAYITPYQGPTSGYWQLSTPGAMHLRLVNHVSGFSPLNTFCLQYREKCPITIVKSDLIKLYHPFDREDKKRVGLPTYSLFPTSGYGKNCCDAMRFIARLFPG